MLGSLLPTAMFIAWSWVILGAVPFDAAAGVAPGETFDPLAVLRTSGDAFGDTVRVFSLLAVTTSFVGFCYGLTDFFADLLGYDSAEEAGSAAGVEAAEAAEEAAAEAASGGAADGIPGQRPIGQRTVLYALALAPPLGFSLWDPSVFFAALDTAGTYGILTLFGIIPAWMAWVQRYGGGLGPAVPDSLPGGKATLAGMVIVASAVVGVETWERLLA